MTPTFAEGGRERILQTAVTLAGVERDEQVEAQLDALASMAAALSAVVACALIFSYGIFTINGVGNVPSTIDATEDTSESEIYEAEIEKN